ncbi:hypothetical protein FS749_009736 [Ceratobasidium sp. UAMH 11750]|nr:hypothetical protein FS749_009736 [Ceratobasidium sp. UAMH 11750]
MSVANALTMPTNLEPRPRSLTRNAVGLVASSLAGLVNTPGVLESARTARDLTSALKTPKENDIIIRKELEVINDMILRIENTAELLQPIARNDPNSPVVVFLVQLQLMVERVPNLSIVVGTFCFVAF